MGKVVAALFIAVCAIFGLGPERWAEFVISGISSWLTPQMAQLAFLTLGFITLITVVWNKIRSLFLTIKKWFSRIFGDIVWIEDPHSIHTFGYIISRPHELALVGHIQLRGKNNKKSSLIVKKAYLRSLVTGEQINAEIEHLEAKDIEIAAKGYFTVYFKFPNEEGYLAQNTISGISIQSFLKRFSNFEIVIESELKKYRIEFNSKETLEWITNVQIGLMLPPPSDKSMVLKRSFN